MEFKKRRIAVIGGSGKMGEWFAGLLKKEGFDVVISGRTPGKLREMAGRLGVDAASNKDAVKGANVILLSVPINTFESVVEEISPLIKPGQKVVDITSVKSRPVKIMHRYFKNNLILGTHPLFGPGAIGLYGMNFVLAPTDENERNFAQRVKSYLEARHARVTLMAPEEHDEMMTVVLGLSHFVALVAADTLSDVKYLKKAESVGGTTFKVLMTLIESVVSENPDLYASIQTSLSGLPELEERFSENASKWADLVKNKNIERFTSRMSELKEIFASGTDFGKSYTDIYKIAQNRKIESD